MDALVAENVTPLWSDDTPAERAYQLGKIENLRVAAKALDGLVIPACVTFSFWLHVGAPLARRGYVSGRMLQEGCMVAAVGGGLCQMSNALYEVALQARCKIIERHAHSRVVPGSTAALGRDATVAWNYVDLRFAPDRDLRLSVRLDRDCLRVRFLGASIEPREPIAPAPDADPVGAPLPPPRSCASCMETDCHIHQREHRKSTTAQAAHVFMVDEAWPEFQAYVRDARKSGNHLAYPLDGRRLRLARYGWTRDGFERSISASIATLRRSAALRIAGGKGAAARRAELYSAERIARRLARLLTPDVTRVTVAQSLLPFLWREGWLGGREVSVLMTRAPMAELQARLDAAFAAHPEQQSLADFRVPDWLIRAETEALSEAARIITPHAEIADLFAGRALRLDWRIPDEPKREPPAPNRCIAFAGPTIARKGAFVVREAAIQLDLEVAPLGAELEGGDFWRGVCLAPTRDWRTAAAIVQPALLEHEPRLLLRALAAGTPVIATKACGIGPRPGLTLIPPNDPEALIAALRLIIGGT